MSASDWQQPTEEHRKRFAIERIKAQPFFLPRVPHPYEGVQWIGIDLAQGKDQTAMLEFNRVDGVILIDPESMRMRTMLDAMRDRVLP